MKYTNTILAYFKYIVRKESEFVIVLEKNMQAKKKKKKHHKNKPKQKQHVYLLNKFM